MSCNEPLPWQPSAAGLRVLLVIVKHTLPPRGLQFVYTTILDEPKKGWKNMTLFTTLLVLAIVACIVYLVVFRKGLSMRDLSTQLLLTLLGTYLGVLASLETSRHLAEEDLQAVVIGQTKIALSQLRVAKSGIDAKRPDAYVDRQIDMALPALKRLASLDGAHRVLGLHAVRVLDSVNYYAERYAADNERAAALRSHIENLWRLLSIRLAKMTHDDRLTQCNSSDKLRTCDAEIEEYLNEALADPDAPLPGTKEVPPVAEMPERH